MRHGRSLECHCLCASFPRRPVHDSLGIPEGWKSGAGFAPRFCTSSNKTGLPLHRGTNLTPRPLSGVQSVAMRVYARGTRRVSPRLLVVQPAAMESSARFKGTSAGELLGMTVLCRPDVIGIARRPAPDGGPRGPGGGKSYVVRVRRSRWLGLDQRRGGEDLDVVAGQLAGDDRLGGRAGAEVVGDAGRRRRAETTSAPGPARASEPSSAPCVSGWLVPSGEYVVQMGHPQRLGRGRGWRARSA